MKEPLRFLLHLLIGLRTVILMRSNARKSDGQKLIVKAQPQHLNRYLVNAINRVPNRIYIHLDTSFLNLTKIGELKRSGKLGSELLQHPNVTSKRASVVDVELDIDYFKGRTDNRLPIWGHPRFNELKERPISKTRQVVFAGSHRSAYREFNEALWSMPNRLNQLVYIEHHIPQVQVHQWIPNQAEYAELLAESSHFLCLPGYKMPLCHNLYEAIEFGCVPVVHSSYRTWLEPELKRATKAFEYSTMEELKSLVGNILSGVLDSETLLAQSAIQAWIDKDYGLKDILQASKAKGKLLLCAEEESVVIHQHRAS